MLSSIHYRDKLNGHETEQKDSRPIGIMYFDVAICFGQSTEFRILSFEFNNKRIKLLRHGVRREEYFFTSITYVEIEDNSKIRVTFVKMSKEELVISIYPQSRSDLITLYTILYNLSIDSNMIFYAKDYLKDVC